jgi:hypothetical protein
MLALQDLGSQLVGGRRIHACQKGDRLFSIALKCQGPGSYQTPPFSQAGRDVRGVRLIKRFERPRSVAFSDQETGQTRPDLGAGADGGRRSQKFLQDRGRLAAEVESDQFVCEGHLEGNAGIAFGLYIGVFAHQGEEIEGGEGPGHTGTEEGGESGFPAAADCLCLLRIVVFQGAKFGQRLLPFTGLREQPGESFPDSAFDIPAVPGGNEFVVGVGCLGWR